MRYMGWLPNATGNLSFGMIGKPLTGRNLVRANIHSAQKRWLLCAARRSNQDPLLSTRILTFIANVVALVNRNQKRPHHRLTYVITATSESTVNDPEGKLVGSIGIVNPKRANLQGAEVAINDLNDYLNSVEENNETASDEKWQLLIKNIYDNCALTCDFVLLRNGKVFLSVKKIDAPDDMTHEIANQCYYFMKDCTHHHYHHNNRSDSILSLTNINNDLFWRQKVIHSLFRKAIALRMNKNPSKLLDALGVIAYARTFYDVFSTHDFTENGASFPAEEMPPYSPSISESINVRREKLLALDEKWSSEYKHVITTIVSIVALYAVIFPAYADKSQAQSIARPILTFLGLNMGKVALLAFMLPALHFIWNSIRYNGLEFINNIYRFFTAFDKYVHILIIGIIFLLLVSSAIALIFIS